MKALTFNEFGPYLSNIKVFLIPRYASLLPTHVWVGCHVIPAAAALPA
jgi:hypothetical protein